MPLEADLVAAIEKIRWAEHIVWIFPMWWYGMPAIMKGFIDRVFLPGIAYEAIPGKMTLKKLFTGKTSRIIVTADTPRWLDRVYFHSPVIYQFKRGTWY